jgi:hypothetical protein
MPAITKRGVEVFFMDWGAAPRSSLGTSVVASGHHQPEKA